MDKTIKINLSTLFLILAIIIIIIMGYLFYKTSNEKTFLAQENTNLESEISSLKAEANRSLETTFNAEHSVNSSTEESSSTSTTSLTESQALEIATNKYKTAYETILSSEVMNAGNYKVNGMQFLYKVNMTELEKLFSTKAISTIKGQLYSYNGQYYDFDNEHIYNFSESIDPGSIFSSTDAGIRSLSIISYTDEYIITTGKLAPESNDEIPLYIIFKKENGNWLIDFYE